MKEPHEQHQWQSLCDECHHPDEALEDLGPEGALLGARSLEVAATAFNQPLVHRIRALGQRSSPTLPLSGKRTGKGRPEVRLSALLLKLQRHLESIHRRVLGRSERWTEHGLALEREVSRIRPRNSL